MDDSELSDYIREVILLYFRVLSTLVTMLIVVCMIWICLTVVLFFVLRSWVRRQGHQQLQYLRQRGPDGKKSLVIGFFHPYCNAGGGGERVLWVAIRALQNRFPWVNCVVYSGDTDATGQEIMRRAYERFNIKLPRPVEFVFLTQRRWVEAQPYPYFTLLGQSLGSLVLGWEAMLKFIPDIYLDTMGYAFTIPLLKYIGGCKVGCYVHYPTISTDMLSRVSQRVAAYNNPDFVAKSSILSFGKILYYRIFAYLYGMAGKRSEVVMVNSSWTRDHILFLWKAPHKTHLLYPPCDIDQFLQLPRSEEEISHNIVSIAQFRPEKDHALQIKSFNTFLTTKSDPERNSYKLILAGSCRNNEDSQRVDDLKSLCNDLGISHLVEFKLNITFTELKELMASAAVGLHSMRDEHFGIGVVELMAAGTIVLAHNSAGPKMDIVVDYHGNKTGFLADSVETYATAMDTIFSLPRKELLEIQINARQSVSRFSEAEFENGFLSITESIIQQEHIN